LGIVDNGLSFDVLLFFITKGVLMLSNGGFSELTFSGNRSSIRTFNSKNINVSFSIKTTPTVFFNAILHPTKEEHVNGVVQIVLNLQKSGATF
jgi:hypothetical protein